MKRKLKSMSSQIVITHLQQFTIFYLNVIFEKEGQVLLILQNTTRRISNQNILIQFANSNLFQNIVVSQPNVKKKLQQKKDQL